MIDGVREREPSTAMNEDGRRPRQAGVRRGKGSIVDRIDEMVDGQLSAGEPRQGHDFDDPTYPQCPHCDRHWHGLPITERIAAMYALGRFDDDYVFASDGSRTLCEGSDFIGPMPSESDAYSYDTTPAWLEQLVSAASQYVTAEIGMVLGVPPIDPHVLREMIEHSNTALDDDT